MSISISPKADAKARQIPDISVRLERFIQDQFELEPHFFPDWHTSVWRRSS